MIIEQSIIQSPNGDIILNMTEDNTDIANQNRVIREGSGGWSQDRDRRMIASIPAKLHKHWSNLLGEECWRDKNFIKSFLLEHPEFATSSNL